MINAKNITYTYKGGESLSFSNIECASSESCLILGESGCGKTTLLHLLAGLLKPKSGSIIIGGKDITKMSSNQLDKFRGKEIGVVFQTAHFVKSISVEKNLLLAQSLAGNKPSKQRVQSILTSLGLADKTKSKPNQLSVGQQQRVAIARAVINKPSIILADEPTSNLDDTNCNEVINLLEKQAQETGATLVIVTHDQRLKDKFQNRIEL